MFDEIAKHALKEYAVEEPCIDFIRHSDNVTYKVTTRNGESYLLRIHVPITSAMGSHGADARMINSEVIWLLALAEETDLVLPEPRRNRSGELVTSILGKNGASINCTLLSWIEGEPYHRDLECEDTAFQIGRLIATMHNQASQWKIPQGFNRPKRDIEYFERMLEGIEPAVNDGRISKPDYVELSKSVSILVDLLRGLDESQRNCGIMHADTHKGNMLLHDGEIRLIDYSFCAIGNYMFDLGVCLSDMKKELYAFCLQGYQSCRPLPENHQRLIEGLFVGSVVGAFCYWVPNPNTQELLAIKVPPVAQNFAAKFNQNQPFLF